MAKKIISIGVALASDHVVEEEFNSRTSLLDWDIVLFRPDITEFLSHAGEYKGRPSLSDTVSFRLRESCEHWRREIKQAVESGRTVIVFLSELQAVYVDTGERQYSGTGKNRAATRLVNPFSNYHCIPAGLDPMNSKGTSVKLAPKGAEVLAPYWAEFSEWSEYQVVLSKPDLPVCLLTRIGDKPVGLLERSPGSMGSLVCLPDIDFIRDSFFEGDDYDWTEEAEQFAARFVSAVVALDAALRSDSDITPEPNWAADAAYALQAEAEHRAKLLEVEADLEKLQLRKEALVDQLKSAGRLRALLYEKGKPLEQVIIDALGVLGFSAKPFKEGASEFDVVFECAEGRLLGEAEGKDTKAINVDKLRQLMMNIQEDLQREEVKAPAKGVLFGNGFRLQAPNERPTAFTEKCVLAANASGTALVATRDLFSVARYIADQKDDAYAVACRLAMLGGVGPTSFPPVPVEPQNALADIG